MAPTPDFELTPQFVGARIQQAIKEAELSLEAAAAAIPASKETLQRYIKGRGAKDGTTVSALTVFRIAEITRKPVGWFAGEGEEFPQEALDRALLAELLRFLDDGQRMAERLRRTLT